MIFQPSSFAAAAAAAAAAANPTPAATSIDPYHQQTHPQYGSHHNMMMLGEHHNHHHRYYPQHYPPQPMQNGVDSHLQSTGINQSSETNAAAATATEIVSSTPSRTTDSVTSLTSVSLHYN